MTKVFPTSYEKARNIKQLREYFLVYCNNFVSVEKWMNTKFTMNTMKEKNKRKNILLGWTNILIYFDHKLTSREHFEQLEIG